MEMESWRKNHARRCQETPGGAAPGETQERPRRGPGGTQEAPRRQPRHPRLRRCPGEAQERPRRHPGGTQEAPRRHPRHPRLQKHLGGEMCSDIGLTPTPNAKIKKISMDVLHQIHPRRENTINYKGKVVRPTLLAESGEGDTHDPRSLSTKVARGSNQRIAQPNKGPLTEP